MAVNLAQRHLKRGLFPHRLRKFIHFLVNIVHPAWIICLILSVHILTTSLTSNSQSTAPPPFVEDQSSIDSPHELARARLMPDADVLRNRLSAAANRSASTTLGNHFCVLQPTLSARKSTWTAADARNHIALRAFLRTFAMTVTPSEQQRVRFSIYYGHDSDDPVFGSPELRSEFIAEGKSILKKAGFADDVVKFVFTPLYGLHGRINAIWNVLAKDAYYDGCDYFFLSNDDMVFFTKNWVSHSVDSLNGLGSPPGHKRPCRYFGIVRFKDEWASWATFTFHVSTRMHMEIFGGVYYPVPYNSAHNDYWINFVYRKFDASKYRGEVRVRNRVDDVDYALANQKDTKRVAPARYEYDKRGNVMKYINEGRTRVQVWLDQNRDTDLCPKPL